MGFAWHKLLDFAMQRVAAEGWIVLPDLQFLRLQFLIARGRIAGGRFALFTRFRAFNGDNFAWHKLFLLFGFLLGLVVVGFDFRHPH